MPCHGSKINLRELDTMSSSNMKRILVPVDGSESSVKAAGQAVKIARLCNGIIEFIHIVKGSVGGYPLSDSDLYPNAEMEALTEAGRKIINNAMEMVPPDLSAACRIVHGEPEEQIVKMADLLAADMIVMGSRGLGAFKSAFIGSVSQYVVERAHCPVMVVKADTVGI
jgi:nucleotide-binding universal stress UspA family protein